MITQPTDHHPGVHPLEGIYLDACPRCNETGLVPTITGNAFIPPEWVLCDCPAGDEAHRRHMSRFGTRLPAHVQVEPACEHCKDRGCERCADWFASRDTPMDYSQVPF